MNDHPKWKVGSIEVAVPFIEVLPPEK